MSRSYKKVACLNDHGRNTRQDKRIASQYVRRKELELVNGGMYKKVVDPWTICDYSSNGFRDVWIRYYPEATRK
jgi:hypothetical protein